LYSGAESLLPRTPGKAGPHGRGWVQVVVLGHYCMLCEGGLAFWQSLNTSRNEGDRRVLFSSYVGGTQADGPLHFGVDDVGDKPPGYDATYAVIERIVRHRVNGKQDRRHLAF
jgi:hypothetical protein